MSGTLAVHYCTLGDRKGAGTFQRRARDAFQEEMISEFVKNSSSLMCEERLKREAEMNGYCRLDASALRLRVERETQNSWRAMSRPKADVAFLRTLTPSTGNR
jgi:hypothetical protein